METENEFLLNNVGLIIILCTYVGAICAHVLSLYTNNFSGTVPFFRQFFPGRSATFYFRLDFVILPVLGTFLAYFLLNPNGVTQGIFAGLSWSGTLVAFLKKGNSNGNNQ